MKACCKLVVDGTALCLQAKEEHCTCRHPSVGELTRVKWRAIDPAAFGKQVRYEPGSVRNTS